MSMVASGHQDVVNDFWEDMQSRGLACPDQPIDDGTLHRFKIEGDKPGSKNGWYILFDDGLPAGSFGSWKTDEKYKWCAKPTKRLSLAERKANVSRTKEAKKQRKVEQKADWDQAANRASKIWKGAVLGQANHPYLTRKGIAVNGARFHKGSLVLALRDFTDELTSLQFIQPDGVKLLLKGGRKTGSYIHVAGGIERPSRVIISEGWATGCTLAEDDPTALVLAAVDAGNLKAVALSARCRWPSVELVIAGDDDRLTAGNPGRRKAHAAAIAADTLLAFPQWPEGAPETLTDFNDLSIWLSRGAV